MHQDVLSSSFFFSFPASPRGADVPSTVFISFFSVTNSVWRYGREGGRVDGRRDYVTKLPAWHGRQMEPQMCVKSGSLETLQRRREERGGGSSRCVALTPPCLSPGFSC